MWHPVWVCLCDWDGISIVQRYNRRIIIFVVVVMNYFMYLHTIFDGLQAYCTVYCVLLRVSIAFLSSYFTDLVLLPAAMIPKSFFFPKAMLAISILDLASEPNDLKDSYASSHSSSNPQ